MARYPRAIETALAELSRLPGIGRRGAERIITHLLDRPGEDAARLSRALGDLASAVRLCGVCGNWSEGELCAVCSDPARETDRLCVVERVPDIYAFEASGAFPGRYHVLGGVLSPLAGVTPEDLRLDELEARVTGQGIREVVIATGTTVEGDATAMYISRILTPRGVEVTRMGLGIPMGASLGYADAGTIRASLEARRRIAG